MLGILGGRRKYERIAECHGISNFGGSITEWSIALVLVSQRAIMAIDMLMFLFMMSWFYSL